MAVRTRMDDVLEQAVAAGCVPGVVAMAADQNGLLYEGAFGKRESGGKVAMTLDTVFFLASMTKAVTCVAAMQQVERGGSTSTSRSARVLPELAAPSVLEGFGAAGAPILRPALRPISLRHLLSHSSGFAYDTWNPRSGATCSRPASRASARPCGPRSTPLAFDPGTRWEYGIGIDWAGQAVETPERPRLEPVLPAGDLRTARHGRHRLLAPTRPAGPQGRRAPAGRTAHLVRAARPRDQPAAGILHGRRRPLLGRARLPGVPPDAPARRHAAMAPRSSSPRRSPS